MGKLLLPRRKFLTGAAAGLGGIALPSAAMARLLFFGGGTAAQMQNAGIYNVKDYGAKGDTIQIPQGAIINGSAALSFTTTFQPQAFTSSDVGKTIAVMGAGTAGAALITTISAFTDATHVTLAANASTTVTDALIYYGTDDTTAIQNTINTVYQFNYSTGVLTGPQAGVVFSPPGIYMISGALQTGGGGMNCQLYVPQLPVPYNPEPKNLTIGFAGTVGLNTSYQVNGGPQWPSTSGSIWFSPLAGSGTSPVILGHQQSGGFNTTLVQMDNMTFRVVYGSTMGGVDMRLAYQMIADTVVVDPAATMTTVAANAPASGGYAIRVPGADNGAKTSLANCTVCGIYDAYDLYEHATLHDCDIYFAHNGFNLNTSNHGMYATTLLAQHVVNVLNVTASSGSVGFVCNELRLEHGGGWYSTAADVNDSGNLLYGSCNYRAVASFSGPINSFTKSGGTHFTATALQP